MKKTRKLIGFICLAALLGFAMAACGEEEAGLNLVAIQVSTQPVKSSYGFGEEFDPEGMVLSGIYDDGQARPIDSGYEVTGLPVSKAGPATVTITYEGFMTTYTVSVYDNKEKAATPVITMGDQVLENGKTYYGVADGTVLTISTTQTEGEDIQLWYSANGYSPSRNGDRVAEVPPYGNATTRSLTLQGNVVPHGDGAPANGNLTPSVGDVTIIVVTVAEGFYDSDQMKVTFSAAPAP